MKATVNRDACIGCGVCVSLCPEVFDLDDENVAVVKIDPVPPELEDDVRDAADSCAVDAIILEE